jgi:GH24 family phage-related lysozyme (muramidase)
MKKILITLLLLLIHGFNYPYNYKELKATKITGSILHLKGIENTSIYNETISYIKEHEGFRSNWYSDLGFACIGYGQRKSCYKGSIEAPITREKADEILRISFNEHRDLVKRWFPRLSYRKNLAISHLSYRMGIGAILKNHLVKGNELDTVSLKQHMPLVDYKFETNLFYNK